MKTSLRIYVFSSSLVLLVLFTLLAFYIYRHPINLFDLNASRDLQSVSWLEPLRYANALFTAGSFRIIYVVLIAAFILIKRYSLIVFVAVAGASELLSSIIKHLIARPRPAAGLVAIYDPWDGYSFISGHTLEYTLLFGFLGFLVLLNANGNAKHYVLASVLFLLPLVVGFGRVYVGAHWLTDITGSYLIGTAILLTLVCLCRGAFEPKRSFK